MSYVCWLGMFLVILYFKVIGNIPNTLFWEGKGRGSYRDGSRSGFPILRFKLHKIFPLLAHNPFPNATRDNLRVRTRVLDFVFEGDMKLT